MDSARQLFVSETPLLDVRAEGEFARGAFPTAWNAPILRDEERAAVGTRYKHQGADAAEQLGHTLVSGEERARRIESWRDYLKQHPDAQMYCFRGGRRSEIACEWLRQEGVAVPRIAGGYKRLRNFLLEEIERISAARTFVILGGKTGSGKTALLKRIAAPFLDLEASARHRGSAFGRLIRPQPTPINFENDVAIQLLKLDQTPDRPLFVEDEGRTIGRNKIPLPLWQAMNQSKIVVLEESLEVRTERIFGEYIVEQWARYQDSFGDAAHERFAQFFLGAVDAIKKRLGGARHQEVRTLMEHALRRQLTVDDLSLHRAWIICLLNHYYDPMYSYQIEQRSERVMLRGSSAELAETLPHLELGAEYEHDD